MRIVMAIMVAWGALNAQVSDRMIANMFMIGFEGKRLTRNAQVIKAICDDGLGGVILFSKNVSSPAQLKALTSQLSQCSHKPLIAVDQEGGKVRRIRFVQDYPRASQVSRAGVKYAAKIYDAMARELHQLGINYNLAPVADLSVNPHNYIIAKLGRSFGSDPARVKKYNSAFIQAMRKHRVLTSLKHFPGHGSSKGDTHQGFVDVTKTWSTKELEPFWNTKATSVMIAHVVNNRIGDPGVPASLSRKAIQTLRRKNPSVVAITDDLQMGAIRKHYSLKETIRRAINAGNDVLLFGNQLSRKHKVNTQTLIAIVRELVASGRIREKTIRVANQRIERMRRTIGLKRGKIPKRNSAKQKTPQRSTKRITPARKASDALKPDLY
jgi:beta-N-acetylhexosaminidase